MHPFTASSLFLLIVFDRFQWVHCQLDALRRCMPSDIHESFDELPGTLDATYERALQRIPTKRRQHAHRLFQFLITAIRPPRVQELAEMFAIKFDPSASPNLIDKWRPPNPEEAILSTCSSLITITEDKGSRIVQFSHFSVKEFLTSDRLSMNENLREYHITLGAAHTVLAQACLAVLLQLDEKADKRRLAALPLASYAARHWVYHAKREDVESQIQEAIKHLFNPKKTYLAAWSWIHDVDRGPIQRPIAPLPERPPRPRASPLYYAVLCGFSELAKHLIVTHHEDVNAKGGYHGYPLHAAFYMGHLDAANVLLDHGADKNLKDQDGKTPLAKAFDQGNSEAVRLLLKRGTNGDVRDSSFGLLLHGASYRGQVEIVRLLLEHKTDVNARGSGNRTPLHWASDGGHAEVVKLLLGRGAHVNAKSLSQETPLHRASRCGHRDVVKILLEHGANVQVRGGNDWTPLQVARSSGHMEVTQLLIEHGAEG